MIESCIMAVGTAPRGANHQRQHFFAIQNSDMKERVGAEWLRPESNRATMIITVGYPHDTASAPEITKIKNGSKKL